MAQSVSKINVTVGANTSQLTSGMQQAASSVQQFSASSGNAQFAVQQLVFAADDAIAVFGTSGFSGALRAAQNNITAFAASLFGVKGLIIAVAGVAAVQLGRSLLNVKSDAEETREEVDRLAEALNRIKVQEGRQNFRTETFNVRQRLARGDSGVAQSVIDDVTKRRAEIARERRVLGKQIGRVDLELLGQSDDDEREKLSKQLAELREQWKTLGLESGELTTQLIAAKERLAELSEVAPGRPGDRFGLFRGDAAAQDIADRLRAGGVNRFDPFSTFGRLPNANAFGSSGAVSAINQAQIGGRNVEDAQLRELQTISRSNGNIERKLGSKLHSLVEVPL